MSFFKNCLLIFFARLFSQKKNRETQRFLVISTTALGDTLWATPALKAIKKAYPECKLSVLVSLTGFQVLQHLPEVDRLYLLPKNLLFSFFSLLRTLRKERFNTVLLFHASQRLVFPLCAQLGASRIIGTKGQNKGLDALLTDALPWKHSHEIQRRLDIIEKIGVRAADFHLHYITTKEEEEKAEGFFREHHLDSPTRVIALHPGAKDFYKCWQKENFITLGKMLQKEGFSILITGGMHEKELLSSIASEIPGSIVLMKPLREFAAILKRVHLMIANDTGPMHLAIALKTPVIALYAPTDPKICGPFHAEHVYLIAKPRTCTPCLRRSCRYPFCMLQITPQEVFEKTSSIVK